MNKQNLGDKAVSIIGGGVGAAIGLFGGPPGAIAGGALGAAFTDILRDVAKRMLSDKEKLRVDNASTYIAEGVIENLDSGRIVRQDDFFKGDANFTSNGSELLEGILMKCKEQYQEKKVRLISNIFKNVAFDSTISSTTAYQVLSLAESLTYTKLCLLSYYGRKQVFLSFSIFNASTFYYPEVDFPSSLMMGIYDLLELYNQGVLSNIMAVTGTDVIVPGLMELTARGKMIFDLLELNQIEQADVLEAIRPLEFQASWGLSRDGVTNGFGPPTNRQVRVTH